MVDGQFCMPATPNRTIDTHRHKLRQLAQRQIRLHELKLDDRKCWCDRARRKIGRESVEAHGEEDRITTGERPVQRICWT